MLSQTVHNRNMDQTFEDNVLAQMTVVAQTKSESLRSAHDFLFYLPVGGVEPAHAASAS